MTTSARPGRARSNASSTAASRRFVRSSAEPSRSGRTTTVSYESGALPSAANGSRSSGTWPSRRRNSSCRPGSSTASERASASDQRTPPVRLRTAGSSLTARTAAKPMPKRPTTASGASSRLAEARSVDSDSTAAASSGAPVFAAARQAVESGSAGSASCRVSRSRPGAPARVAASAAFWASSTTRRSRWPPRARSSSALASSRKRAAEVDQAVRTASRRIVVRKGSGCPSGVVRITPGRLTDGLPLPVPAGYGPPGVRTVTVPPFGGPPLPGRRRAGRPRLPRTGRSAPPAALPGHRSPGIRRQPPRHTVFRDRHPTPGTRRSATVHPTSGTRRQARHPAPPKAPGTRHPPTGTGSTGGRHPPTPAACTSRPAPGTPPPVTRRPSRPSRGRPAPGPPRPCRGGRPGPWAGAPGSWA